MSEFYFEFDAIGSRWFIKVSENLKEERQTFLSKEIVSLCQEFEKKYSRFLPDSYVSLLNKNRSLLNPPEELVLMIQYSLDISEITDNSFSLFSGAALESLGYDKDYSFSSQEQKVSAGKVELGDNEILLLGKGNIELGGIGKGWLIDKVSNFLKEQGLETFTVNGGGDLYYFGKEEKSFILENPFDTSQMIGHYSLKNGSLACSSSNKRKWIDRRTGNSYHHLINGKTGLPRNDLIAVFVYGKNAVSADTGSTALFVSDESLHKKIADYLGISYLIIYPDMKFVKSNGYEGILES